MPTRTSESLKYIDQGNFPLWKEDFDSVRYQRSSDLLAYSNVFGVVFVAHNAELQALALLPLEEHFEGDNEVEAIPSESRLCTLILEQPIQQILLSSDERWLAVVSESRVLIYNTGAIASGGAANPKASFQVAAKTGSANFSCAWHDSSDLVILQHDEILVANILSAAVQVHKESGITALCSCATGHVLVASGRGDVELKSVSPFRTVQKISLPFEANSCKGKKFVFLVLQVLHVGVSSFPAFFLTLLVLAWAVAVMLVMLVGTTRRDSSP